MPQGLVLYYFNDKDKIHRRKAKVRKAKNREIMLFEMKKQKLEYD